MTVVIIDEAKNKQYEYYYVNKKVAEAITALLNEYCDDETKIVKSWQ